MSQPTTLANPTSRDGLFFLTILMNMKNNPQVDWDFVAAQAGFKNAKVASTRFGQMKKKFASSDTASNSNPTTPTTSFTSATTEAKTPTPSPTKRAKREVGGGTIVVSGGVKKSPVKTGAFARSFEEKVKAKLGNGGEDVRDVFVRGGAKWEYDDEYMEV